MPIDLRKIVLDTLFDQYVKRCESAIVDEIYMTPDHLKILFESGMNISSHGHDHARLEYMGAEAQKSDVEQSIKHLRSIGIHDSQTVFCYPYGSFNNQCKSVIKEIGCELAVSIIPGVVDLDSAEIDWWELRRIDAKFFDDYFPVFIQN